MTHSTAPGKGHSSPARPGKRDSPPSPFNGPAGRRSLSPVPSTVGVASPRVDPASDDYLHAALAASSAPHDRRAVKELHTRLQEAQVRDASVHWRWERL